MTSEEPPPFRSASRGRGAVPVRRDLRWRVLTRVTVRRPFRLLRVRRRTRSCAVFWLSTRLRLSASGNGPPLALARPKPATTRRP
jgi:hypothetical protein